MLNEYTKTHNKAKIQYSLLNSNGDILDTDNVIFLNLKNTNIAHLHPFFESVIPLLNHKKDEEFLFSCIHLQQNKQAIITDISLYNFKNKNHSLLIINDLTAHYNNYQLTAQVRNESVINNQILELKNEYLKEKETFKNKFIANFSHEIREPLSGISTFIDILSKTNLSATQKDYINVINTASNQLKHMIEDILDISKIEAGKLNLVDEFFNIEKILEELAFTYQVKANQKGISFTYTIGDKVPMQLEGDPYRLKQILSNLLDNAIKYTTNGGIDLQINLNQIRANKASLHFKLTDTGIGIPAEQLDRVFDSFTQLNTDEKNGTGLGLAIVKNLISLMQGNISLNSKEKKGTQVDFNLKFKINSEAKTETPEIKPVVKIKKPKNNKWKVLLVENSEISQLAVLKILASQGNFYLDIIPNAEDVIPTLQNTETDIILMDINLPNISGDEVAKKIRALPEKELSKTPIIALTGKVFPEDIKRYKKAKINDVVAKPFNEKSLIQTMLKYLK